mmetsp:Transcript_18074/g.26750  ORF Transcript_18074/g.26750 Transcript_18074/m.26750 type:complete len:295 (+) Transcript_18074:137-1021(+)|eukprot:CAMPEP_0194219646 /NCGR_PEP_ID=MMETSP0156-20130528/26461_1 /TAXON_ID=33649 /ORGANISM="Thalassionema nitzschioides, Strain L26-B" /LENGTH=294 /DNA_ID=CAMNT_0038949397 /DNA_START=68 /DNA_END=952 /DNA_ORIENTATION=-
MLYDDKAECETFFSTILSRHNLIAATKEMNSKPNRDEEETKATFFSDESASTISDDLETVDESDAPQHSFDTVFDFTEVFQDLEDTQSTFINPLKQKVRFHPTSLVSDVWEIPYITLEEKYERYYSKTELWKFRAESKAYQKTTQNEKKISEKTYSSRKVLSSSMDTLTSGLSGLFQSFNFTQQKQSTTEKFPSNRGRTSFTPHVLTARQAFNFTQHKQSTTESFLFNRGGTSSTPHVLTARPRSIHVPSPNPYRDSTSHNAARPAGTMQVGEPWYDFEVPLDTNVLYDSLYQF